MQVGLDYRCSQSKQPTGVENVIIRLGEHWPKNHSCNLTLFTNRLRLPEGAWFHGYLPAQIAARGLQCFVFPLSVMPKWIPKSVRKVSVVYDLAYFHFPDQYSTRDRLFMEGDFRKTLNRSDLLIAISERTKEDLVHFTKVPENKIVVAHLASDLGSKCPMDPLPEAVPREPYILMVGTGYGRKNMQIAVPTAELLNKKYGIRFPFVISGKKGFLENKLLEDAKELGIEKQFIHLGYVNERELASLYKNASLLFFPSLYEGFGIPLLEAMNFDCPVVCSNSSCLPEVAGPAAQYFSPTSPEEAAKALAELFGNSNRRQELIEAGRIRSKLFSWDKMAKKVADEIEKRFS